MGLEQLKKAQNRQKSGEWKPEPDRSPTLPPAPETEFEKLCRRNGVPLPTAPHPDLDDWSAVATWICEEGVFDKGSERVAIAVWLGTVSPDPSAEPESAPASETPEDHKASPERTPGKQAGPGSFMGF